MPAVAIRGAATKLASIDQRDLDSHSPELTFSMFLGSLTREVDKTGDNLGASTQVGIRF